MPKPEKKSRNIEMYARWKTGEWSLSRLGEFYNIKKQTVHRVIKMMDKRKEEENRQHS